MAERALIRPDDVTDRAQAHGSLVNAVAVGPFEQEEKSIGITSDVVKVEGADPDTTGHLIRDRVRLVGASPFPLLLDTSPFEDLLIHLCVMP